MMIERAEQLGDRYSKILAQVHSQQERAPQERPQQKWPQQELTRQEWAQQERVPRERASNEQAAACQRILIVDDDLDMAKLLRELLQSWGYQVETAGEVRSAIEAVFSFGPQIILLDIDLPWIDGYEIAKLLRSDSAFNTIKLIALTGYGGHTGKVRALKAGFDQHMTKPIDIDKLKNILIDECNDKPTAHAALD
jgi:CheY-like chemotaxis protein